MEERKASMFMELIRQKLYLVMLGDGLLFQSDSALGDGPLITPT
jgi:hypothetical protein